MKLLRSTPNKEVDSQIPVRLSAVWVQFGSLVDFEWLVGFYTHPFFWFLRVSGFRVFIPIALPVIAVAAIAHELPGGGLGLFELDANKSACKRSLSAIDWVIQDEWLGCR